MSIIAAGQVIPNRVIVSLGSNGKIDVYSPTATNVIVDISGYYTAAGGAGAIFVPARSPSGSANAGRQRTGGIRGPVQREAERR